MPQRPPAGCYDKAAELLARRPHFRRELERKLAQRGYARSEIGEALGRLEERGALDDAGCARTFLTARLRKGLGPRRLRAELLRRGAEPEIIEAALAELLPADEAELARRAAASWSARGRGDAAALARHLDRRGFSRRAILTVLEERPGGNREGTEE